MKYTHISTLYTSVYVCEQGVNTYAEFIQVHTQYNLPFTQCWAWQTAWRCFIAPFMHHCASKWHGYAPLSCMDFLGAPRYTVTRPQVSQRKRKTMRGNVRERAMTNRARQADSEHQRGDGDGPPGAKEPHERQEEAQGPALLASATI